MASRFIQAFKQPDMRKKLLFTLFVLVLYRVGVEIPVPGIPFYDLAEAFNESAGALAVLNLFSGGALSQMSLLSLGIMPYITASIIMLLLGVSLPNSVGKWKKDGVEGKKKTTRWTRILTIGLGAVNAIGYDIMFQNQYGIIYPGCVPSILSNTMVVFTLVVGVVIIMWMGELITQNGIGNGMSIIIFTHIVSSIPASVVESIRTANDVFAGVMTTLAVVAVVCIAVPVIVFVERAQRRVPVKSTQSGGNASYARRSDTNYIPVPIDIAGLYAVIFASSFTMLPVYAAAWLPNVEWLQWLSTNLTSGWLSWTVSFVMIVAFAFFMASINFNCEDVAENLKKQGQYVPGIRPGSATREYFQEIVSHVSLFGALFIALLATASSMAFFFTNNQLLQAFGGTSILVMVSVSISFMTAIEQSTRASDPESVLKRLGR